ncbi:MAG TPA: hypothetical protein PKA95_02435 [Thermomicrobiales bacterium]|nr:hypothetical protein [Thermomicrobiales bacterium]
MNERAAQPGGNGSGGESDWPQTPGELVYLLDAVVKLFEDIQQGERVDLLERLLDCVDWREMFGADGAAPLAANQIEELRRYYRAKFAALDRFYLAEQLSTELMTALMASGDMRFSDDLRRLGRDRPELWQEIRTFFSRKELATSMAMLADDQPAVESS